MSQPSNNTKKLWNSTHIYKEFVEKSTVFMLSIGAELKMPLSPDIYSGDNQHTPASSFRSYLNKWLA